MPVDTEDSELYVVVVNHEAQYSIWPAESPVPDGWGVVGAPRVRSECLDYIEQVWTDMRPLSLREKMQSG